MKYKTEIIKIKKKILIEYDSKLNLHEQLWFFVWLSFGVTIIVCASFYYKTYKTLKNMKGFC